MISGVLNITHYVDNCSLTAIFVLMQHSNINSIRWYQFNAIVIVRLQKHAPHAPLTSKLMYNTNNMVQFIYMGFYFSLVHIVFILNVKSMQCYVTMSIYSNLPFLHIFVYISW